MTVTGCESYYIRVIRVCLSSALARRGSPRLNPSERESLDDTGNAQTEYNGVKSGLCDLLGSAVSEAVDDWGSAGWGAGVERATLRNGALSLVAV